ncbi:MAG: hypothetical protein D6752_06690 [Candidatus Nitrosothermus koennekii]|nr:MAG: hypothetical protein D6752_06690 [Candidatus Nitrosothermus koennekii]
MISTSIIQAYGHGLGKEEVGPKNIGDKLVSMDIEITPEFKKADELQDITLHIQFHDVTNGEDNEQVIPGVAANIEIYRFRDNQLLLNQTFHVMSDVETLEVLFKNTESGDINIKGMKMGSFGYMRAADEDMVIVEGPIFTKAGLYKFKVTPIALDSESLPEDQRVPFEALITLSEVKNWEIDGHTIQTIAYYDSLTNLEYDPDNLVMKAEMPFDWDLVDQISLLHFEYYLPKGFELANRELTGYINGIEQSIFVDRSSEDWGAVVHFMIGQKRLKELAPMMEGDDLKRAVLEIRGGAIIEEQPKEEEKITLPEEWSPAITVETSNKSVQVEVQWSPIEIDVGQDTFFKLTFKDPNTGEVLKDVKYDIMLMDSEGNMIAESHRSAQTKEIQIYRFDEPGSYTLMLKNVNDTGESAMISLKVVPEFPLAALIPLVVGFSVLAAMRLRKNSNTFTNKL